MKAVPKAMSAYVGLRIASLDEEMEGELGTAAASLLLSPFTSALLRKGTSFLGVGAATAGVVAAGVTGATAAGVAGVVAGVDTGDVGGGLFWVGHSRIATPGAATAGSGWGSSFSSKVTSGMTGTLEISRVVLGLASTTPGSATMTVAGRVFTSCTVLMILRMSSLVNLLKSAVYPDLKDALLGRPEGDGREGKCCWFNWGTITVV